MIYDRGMVKWMPYKSLPEQEDFLRAHKEVREKETRPQMSEDQLEEMDETLKSLNSGDRITIVAFWNGHRDSYETVFSGISNGLIETADGAFSPSDILSLKRD